MNQATNDSEKLDPRIWKTAAVVLLAPFMTLMDSTVVNVSLTSIRDQLATRLGTAQWIMSGYLLALALVLPLNGWLVDRVGAKRLYLWCFSTFTLASALCGLSRTVETLICARVFQGICGGLLVPMTSMMIARAAGKHMARVMGYAAVPLLAAPILGPVLAGAILKYASWPWLFFINLPVGILAVALAAFLLPNDEPTSAHRPFDFPGFFLISPGLALFLYGLEKMTREHEPAIFVLGLVFLGGFIFHSSKVGKRALVDLSLFKNKIFSAATLTQSLSNGVAYGGQFLMPMYLITGCGIAPAQAGWMLAPMGVGMLFSYPMMGYLTDRFGCRAVSRSGAMITTLGTLPFIWMVQHHFSFPLLVVCLLARGAGQGAIGIPSSSAAYASVPKENLANATTALNICQRIGGPIATTLLAMVMADMAPGQANPSIFLLGFSILIGLQVMVLASASRLPVLVHSMSSTLGT